MIEEIRLDKAAYGGESIGRLPDGRAVFVPFSLPGEMVRIQITEDKKKYARGKVVEVLKQSPERVSPRCSHFGTCGGCHYQHIAYEEQLVLKQSILKDQLERIGRLADPPIDDIVPSPGKFNYRNHVQFHLSGAGKLGFIRANKKGVLEINECHLPEEALNEIWPLLEIDPKAGISSLDLRLGIDDDVLLTLKSSGLFEADFNIEDLPISVIHASAQGEQILAGSSYTVMQVLDRKFQVSAGSFFQVNIPLVEKMVAAVKEMIPETSGTILELYAGVGLFSAFIAGRAEKLVAVEDSAQAGEDFVVNLDEFDNVELYQGGVEEIMPHLEIQPELVIMDPPRTGVDKKVLDKIISIAPEKIIYISCDPATLARDSRKLVEGGYSPARFIPFDLFPQTYHIETLSYWLKL